MNIIKHNWDWTHSLSKRQATDTIVIHHAAADNASPEAVHQWHKHNGWAGIGYHLYIRKDGSIHEGRPLWASGANVLNHNWHTIGVCCEGNYDVSGAVMPKAQMDALHEAIRYMKKLYPSAAVKFHRDFGGTVCPGRYFPAQEALDYAEKPAQNPKEEDKPMRYNSVSELPEWARKDIQKLIDLGHLRGGDGGKLDLSMDMVRTIIICGRMQGVL